MEIPLFIAQDFEKSKIFSISNSIVKVTENIAVLSCVH